MRLVIVRDRNTTNAVRIVRIPKLSKLLRAASVQLNIFPGKRFTAIRNTIERRTDFEFVWTGRIPDKQGSVILVSIKKGLTSTIRVDKELYKVEPCSFFKKLKGGDVRKNDPFL